MNSRIASLENTAKPNIRFRHKHPAYERGSATASKINEISRRPSRRQETLRRSDYFAQSDRAQAAHQSGG